MSASESQEVDLGGTFCKSQIVFTLNMCTRTFNVPFTEAGAHTELRAVFARINQLHSVLVLWVNHYCFPMKLRMQLKKMGSF